MNILQMAPVDPRSRTFLEIDLDDWSESIGEGGFAVAFANSRSPDAVLKCMDRRVDGIEAQSAMLRLSRHAKVMTERLTEIIRDTGTPPFARSTSQTLLSTIITHVGYEANNGQIYLYQNRAPGQSLADLLAGETPPWADRVRIAKNFVSAMVALRRCRVVHLDQRPVNVFVDMASPARQVTLIDLDGCGVLPEHGPGERRDEWQIRPVTMGRAEDMAKPLWYPFDPTWQGPLSGNFKFAERWCVINETWKILSWGMPALGWLEPVHDELLEGATKVREMFNVGAAHLPADQHAQYLKTCQRAIAAELSHVRSDAMTHTRSIMWEEYNIGNGSPAEDAFFTQLALFALYSYADAKDLRLPESRHSARTREIPSAQWLQRALLDQFGA